MKYLTRGLCLLIALSACVTTAASADAYPSKQIRLVVPYPPGGPSDVTARVIGQKLAEKWSQPVIVDNRPGANGNIAAAYVASSPPDGYTILMGNVGANAISLSLYKKLSYSVKSFAPITQTGTVPIVLIASPSSPYKTLDDVISYAKANPGQLAFATAGNGSSTHLVAEMFSTAAGIKMSHVPYKGDAPAIVDVVSGQVPLMFSTAVSAIPQIKGGKVRPIAVSTAKRAAALPDVPTIAEGGFPTFDSSSWGGLLAPANTPADIVNKMHDTVVQIMDLPEIKTQLGSLGIEMVSSTPQQFGQYMISEEAKWAAAVKASGAVAD